MRNNEYAIVDGRDWCGGGHAAVVWAQCSTMYLINILLRYVHKGPRNWEDNYDNDIVVPYVVCGYVNKLESVCTAQWF
jgi:hypothetical protein